MTREELEKLIDDEVNATVTSTNMREPEVESPNQIVQEQPAFSPEAKQVARRRANLSKEELDDIIFYGGEKPGK